MKSQYTLFKKVSIALEYILESPDFLGEAISLTSSSIFHGKKILRSLFLDSLTGTYSPNYSVLTRKWKHLITLSISALRPKLKPSRCFIHKFPSIRISNAFSSVNMSTSKVRKAYCFLLCYFTNLHFYFLLIF